MAERILLNDLTYVTLLSLDYGKSSGSGFLLSYQNSDYLVTARHVLYDNDELRCKSVLISSQNSRSKNEDSKMFDIKVSDSILLDNRSTDVAIIPLGNIAKMELKEYVDMVQVGTLQPLSINQHQLRLLNDIGIANEVYLVGFPTSLLFQDSKAFEPGKPLLRKGIVAGINWEDGTFIIDCSAYYGNSGGPVIELCEDNQLRVIGIVSRYIPFVIEWRNNREMSVIHAEYANSGYSVCIPIDAVLNLINQ